MRAIAHCQEPRSSWTVAMQGPRTTEGMTAMASNWPESAAILVVIFSVITFALPSAQQPSTQTDDGQGFDDR